MLAPRIAALYRELAGVIVWAGPGRPFEDIYVEQIEYLASLQGLKGERLAAVMKPYRAQWAKVKDPELSFATPPDQLLLGGPAQYWLDLRDFSAPELAKTLKQPFLILQGERDYNVTMKDFELWKKALAGREDVVFKSYPKGDHDLVSREGHGLCTPRDMLSVGHVDPAVLEDVAAFIAKH